MLKKLFASYIGFVDAMQRINQTPSRFGAHFLAMMWITSPLTVGLIIHHRMEQSAHPEKMLRDVAVGTASEYPKLAPIMPVWIACFDNTILNKDYGHCDYEVRPLLEKYKLEQSFAKYQRYRDSMYSASTGYFHQVGSPPEKDE
jgi:hypothetical protein